MKKNNLILITFGAVFVVGITILMNCINMGENEVTNILNAKDGMDTGTYLIYLEQSITKYRFIGLILSILGGLGVLKILTNQHCYKRSL